MAETSKRINGIAASPIRKLAPLAEKAKARGVKVYHLNIGQPDIRTPEVAIEALRRIDRTVLEYSPSQGFLSLREKIAVYYSRYGMDYSPDQIIVGAGNDYLMMLLCAVIGTRRRVALENPTYKQAYRLFENLSCEVCTVDMDAKGMRADELEKSGADIAFVMPSHQYPLGTVMPIKRRMELLAWADECEDRYIIEDDYDSEFRYKGKPIPALQGYDGNGKVIYIGTFSKSIAPAIRMSYLVLPADLCSVYEERCSFISSTVSKVDQLILQKFIEDGYYERHLNKMRALYKSRHDTLLSALKNWNGGFSVSGENAGVHLLLHFHDGRSEEELIDWKRKLRPMLLSGSDVVMENQYGEIPMEILPEELPYDISQDVIEIKPEDYGIWFFDTKDNPERYKGKTVEFTACIMKSRELEKDVFVPGRMAMTCCEADMTFIGFLAHSPEISHFENYAWVKLRAKVDIRMRQEYQGEGPFLEVLSMVRTGEIAEPVGF